MDYVTILGFLAGTLTTIAFVPQVVKTWKTKSAKDVSLYMYLILSVGIFSWFLYGIFLNSYPIIIANTVGFFLSVTVLGFKIKFG